MASLIVTVLLCLPFAKKEQKYGSIRELNKLFQHVARSGLL